MMVKKIHKTAGEMQTLIKKSRRKLLELEVALSFAEIAEGKRRPVGNAKRFVDALK